MSLTREQYGRLLVGLPINVFGLNVRCLTLNELFDNDGEKYSKYQSAVQLLNIDKLELFMIIKRDLDKFSLLSLHMLMPGLSELLADFLELFFNPVNVVWNRESIEIKVVAEDGSSMVITNENYRKLFKIIADIYNIGIYETEEDIDFGTETARLNWRVYQHRLRQGMKVDSQYKTQIDLFSIVSSVVNIGRLYDYETIKNLTVFQLYDSYNRLDAYERYQNVNRIRTSGMFDTSKAKLPDLHWAEIIKSASDKQIFET